MIANAAVSSSGIVAGYPEVNCKQPPISQPVRLSGVSGKWLEFDLGMPRDFNFVIIVNHNITKSATVTFTTDSVPGPIQNPIIVFAKEHDCFSGMPSRSFQYARLTFNDASNPDGFIQIGLIMLGQLMVPTYNFKYGWTKERAFYDSLAMSEFGVDHNAPLFDDWALQLQFENRLPIDMDALAELYEKLGGRRKKIFLMPDSAVSEGYFGRITNSFVRTYEYYHHAALSFRSDSRGKKIGA